MPQRQRMFLGLTGRTLVAGLLIVLAGIFATTAAWIGLTRQGESLRRLASVEVEQLVASTRLLQQVELLANEGRLLAVSQSRAERRQNFVMLADRMEWAQRLMLELRQAGADEALMSIDAQLRKIGANLRELDLAVGRQLDAPGHADLGDAAQRLLEQHEALAGTLSARVGLVTSDLRRQVREHSDQLVSEVQTQRRQLLAISAGVLVVVLFAALYVEVRVVRRVLRLKQMVDEGRVDAAAVGPADSDKIAQLAETVSGYIERLAEHERVMAQANENLAFLAEHDMLTQLPNRRHFEAASLRLLAATRMPVFAIIGDIDYFKRINDGHGHAVGDLALKHIAGVLRAGLRKDELLARMGGEEFNALVPAHSSEEAIRVVERIRMSLAESPLQLPGGGALPMTISFGVARVALPPLPTGEDALRDALAEALGAADGALYAAKAAGRNRTELAAGQANPHKEQDHED